MGIGEGPPLKCKRITVYCCFHVNCFMYSIKVVGDNLIHPHVCILSPVDGHPCKKQLIQQRYNRADLVLPYHSKVPFRPLLAVLIMIDTLHSLTFRQLVAHYFDFHCANPRLANVLVASAYFFYDRRNAMVNILPEGKA